MGTSTSTEAREPGSSNLIGKVEEQDMITFELSEDYCRWTLSSVVNAYHRFTALKERDVEASVAQGDSELTTDNNKFLVNRREFWETFTDYTCIVNGAFLTLPIKNFAVYAADDPNHVFVYEVFIMLTLFCDGLLNERVEFLFKLFDLDNKGYLAETDMLLLLQSLTFAARKVGITKFKPNGKELHALTKEMFSRADTNHDAIISSAEFFAWATMNIHSRALLQRFNTSKRRETAIRNAIKERVRPRGPKAMLRRQQQARSRAAKSVGARQTTLGVPSAIERPTSKRGGRRGSDSGGHTGVDMSKVRIAARRVRARKLHTVARRNILRDLSQATKFTMKELTQVGQVFVDTSLATAELNKPLFEEVLLRFAPSLATDTLLLTRLYNTLDVNGNGLINFREFTVGLSTIMKGSLDEKMNLIFAMYDTDGDGSMSIVELARLIKHGKDELKAMVEFSEEVMQSLDRNGDKQISRTEFAMALAYDTALLDTFRACISTITPEMAQRIYQLKIAESGITFRNLNKMWAKLRKQRDRLLLPISLQQFREFIRDQFGCDITNTKTTSLLDMVYQEFESQSKAATGSTTGRVMVRDVLNGFAQVLATTASDQASFFFDYYDADGSGTMDTSEILRMLLESQAATEEAAQHVIDTLFSMDTDNDGEVTLNEFKRFAVRDPIIMSAIQKLFGTGTIHDAISLAAVESAEKTSANPLLIRPDTFYITRAPGDYSEKPGDDDAAKPASSLATDKMNQQELLAFISRHRRASIAAPELMQVRGGPDVTRFHHHEIAEMEESVDVPPSPVRAATPRRPATALAPLASAPAAAPAAGRASGARARTAAATRRPGTSERRGSRLRSGTRRARPSSAARSRPKTAGATHRVPARRRRGAYV